MSTTPPHTLLHLENVNAFYGAAHILHDLNLRVDAGEKVALIGRNGVGKTTVVNTILGLAQLRGGTLTVAGRRLVKPRIYMAAQGGVAVVPQGRCIVPNLTVEQNLLLGAATAHKRKGYSAKPERKAGAAVRDGMQGANRSDSLRSCEDLQRRRPPESVDARDAVGFAEYPKGIWNTERIYQLFPILQERAHTPGTALSGGQQQMLAVGRALMANPSLILLDEPSEGLAPVIVDQLADIFNQVAQAGTTLLLIEQNMSLVARVAQRYCAMSKGSVIAEGSVTHASIEELHRHVMV